MQQQTPPPFDQQKMQQLTQELQQLYISGEISHWPLALGYWLLLILIVACVLGLGWYFLKNRYRSILVAQLNNLYQNHRDPIAYITQMNALLRQLALKITDRRRVSKLSQQQWVHFLKQHSKDEMPQDFITAITQSIYQKKI